MSLSSMIPNYEREIERLMGIATSGFVLAFNVTFRGPEHLHQAYPPDWVEQYQRRNYVFLDPITFWGFSNQGELRWSAVRVPDLRGIMIEAKAYGLRYGAVFSRKRGDKRSLLSVARADRELTDTEIEVLASKFDSWVDMVVGGDPLTAAELDVLRLLKEGLGQADIAVELSISESAVKQRCLRACAKLNAKTRTQAVAIAVARNYFSR
jgi:LuxR family transcriptional regulator, quorum-sensing system regulator SdiA